MAVPAEIVFSGIVTLRAFHCVNVEPAEVGNSQKNVIGQRSWEPKSIAIVVKYELVDEAVRQGDRQWQSVSCEHESLVFFVAGPMNPFKEADCEAEDGYQQR